MPPKVVYQTHKKNNASTFGIELIWKKSLVWFCRTNHAYFVAKDLKIPKLQSVFFLALILKDYPNLLSHKSFNIFFNALNTSKYYYWSSQVSFLWFEDPNLEKQMNFYLISVQRKKFIFL